MSNKIAERQSQYVAKANSIIRCQQSTLTTEQQKVLAYLISLIRPDDLSTTIYSVKIDELCRTSGIDFDTTGYYYKAIKNDLRILATPEEYCLLPDNSEVAFTWIVPPKINRNSGTIEVMFNPFIAPYLFALKEQGNYTQYRLDKVLVFRGKYTIRLYEIIRSYMKMKKLEVGIEQEVSFQVSELRKMLDVSSYPRWSEFERNVIRKSVDEINLCSDEMNLSYDTYKGSGKNIEVINFIIQAPKALQQQLAHQERRKRL